MSKRKSKEPGLSAKDAAFEAKPGMVNLDLAVRQIAAVPKAVVEQREAEWKATRGEKKL